MGRSGVIDTMEHDYWRDAALAVVHAAREHHPGVQLTRCACGTWHLPHGKTAGATECSLCYWRHRNAREAAEERALFQQAIRNGYIPLRDRPATNPESNNGRADGTPDDASGQLGLFAA